MKGGGRGQIVSSPPTPKLQLIIFGNVEWNVISCLMQDRRTIGDSLNFRKGCFERAVILGRIRKEIGTFGRRVDCKEFLPKRPLV
ncbi:hypothetical protein CEXT_515301 [Caerostris extrusa]|uniref:Uncharacterized protein n=1 Tax=Caerostris extrusa TaxID=172846 RepID=A0AAV4NXU4_CAEEX|nr:hypothetical protein CEXT_515301 [Caerostris extrusa]